MTASATTKFPLKLKAAYAYYEVQALNSLGQTVGTSAPIQAPSSIAIFGHSAYVGAKGPVGVPVACLNLKPCQVEAQIFDGTRRVAHSDITGVSAHGGQLLVPMSTQTHRLVTTAAGRHLPVTVTLMSATGAKVSRPLTLVSYAWTGGVLAACRSIAPCVSTVHVTLAGAALAKVKTTTLGPGEIGYLTYNLNNKGHKLLRAAQVEPGKIRVRQLAPEHHAGREGAPA